MAVERQHSVVAADGFVVAVIAIGVVATDVAVSTTAAVVVGAAIVVVAVAIDVVVVVEGVVAVASDSGNTVGRRFAVCRVFRIGMEIVSVGFGQLSGLALVWNKVEERRLNRFVGVGIGGILAGVVDGRSWDGSVREMVLRI